MSRLLGADAPASDSKRNVARQLVSVKGVLDRALGRGEDVDFSEPPEFQVFTPAEIVMWEAGIFIPLESRRYLRKQRPLHRV